MIDNTLDLFKKVHDLSTAPVSDIGLRDYFVGPIVNGHLANSCEERQTYFNGPNDPNIKKHRVATARYCYNLATALIHEKIRRKDEERLEMAIKPEEIDPLTP